jgi:aconitate hydratase 2/2-methylisocitrate dehydratase
MALLEDYRAHAAKRAELGVPPLALTADQTAELVELLKANPIVDVEYAMDLFKNKIPAGVDDAVRDERRQSEHGNEHGAEPQG